MIEPKYFRTNGQYLRPTASMPLAASRSARPVARWLQTALDERLGRHIRIASSTPTAGCIRLKLPKRLTASEAFTVQVNQRGATLSARSVRGLRYAAAAFVDRFDADTGTFSGCVIEDAPVVEFRAYLMHLTHYDARWVAKRWSSQPFDMNVARQLVPLLADCRINNIIVDIGDAVRYRSHPELTRKSSAPMSDFAELVKLAKSFDIDVIPKLNFAQSRDTDFHNHWFRPYDALDDTDDYFRIAFDLIDELIDIVKPRYFHIGMDEDHDRPADKYVRCVKLLNRGLKARGLRTIQWIDLDKAWARGPWRRSALKSREALDKLPKDVILTHWVYDQFKPLRWVKRHVDDGRTVLGGTLHRSVLQGEVMRAFTREVVARNALGMVATIWLPLRKSNLNDLTHVARLSGRVFWNGG